MPRDSCFDLPPKRSILAEEHAVADHRHACNLDAWELGPEPRVFERGIRERVVEVEPEAAREQGQHGVEHCPAREAAACHPGARR